MFLWVWPESVRNCFFSSWKFAWPSANPLSGSDSCWVTRKHCCRKFLLSFFSDSSSNSTEMRTWCWVSCLTSQWANGDVLCAHDWMNLRKYVILVLWALAGTWAEPTPSPPSSGFHQDVYRQRLPLHLLVSHPWPLNTHARSSTQALHAAPFPTLLGRPPCVLIPISKCNNSSEPLLSPSRHAPRVATGEASSAAQQHC